MLNNQEKIKFLNELIRQLDDDSLQDALLGRFVHPEEYEKLKNHLKDKWYACGECELFPWPPDYTLIPIYKGYVLIGRLVKKEKLFTFDLPIPLRECYFDTESEALDFLHQYYKAVIRKPKI